MSNSYSQLGQDIYVLQKYQHKKNGFFVEVGACDGIYLSNTYLLETQYDWKGICIEPIPHWFNECVKNRPNSICIQDAVYSENDLTLEFNIADSHVLSGITAHVDKHVHSLNGGRKINVNTKTLTWILDAHNAPQFIEYLSLDTEGSEFEVLKGINFDKYKFGIIDIEHNYIEPRRTQMREFLLLKNYIYVGQNDFDDRYELKIEVTN
ncbi:MAG: FkbM family methyltransferase [Terrestrivirus sp.]|uniref:FkbM family methyltransferase n=1 Tax=Terrestrivirus sp. TaxID=2487775 RepID=A0A3G4ZNG5_9VIRU|nr:MAG: FkbM family methyltransferase [Terrestrivirus sp.]